MAKKISILLGGFALLFFVVFFILSPYDSNGGEDAPLEDYGTVDVRVFGIGRADAILITTANHTLLIDTGENRHGEYLVAHLRALDISFIDYVIITHFDSDHVGGAHTIIDAIPIGEVIVPNYSRETRHVERFDAALARAGMVPYVLTQPRFVTLDGVDFIFDASSLPYIHFARVMDDDDYDDDFHDDDPAGDAVFIPTGNDFSIVVGMTHGRNHFLFTGDAMNHRLAEVLQNDLLMADNSMLLKVPRHGRHTANTVELIHRLRPYHAVITGFHPDDSDDFRSERPTDWRIVHALDYVGTQVFYTMRTGVRFTSDGYSLTAAYIE